MQASYDLVLLDRDGVINEDLPMSVQSWSQFHFIPSSLDALAHLSKQPLKLALVTNQAVVGRGELSLEALEEIHAKMLLTVEKEAGTLHKIYYCTDTRIEPNYRRKPAPGMLLEAMKDFMISPQRTLMIGDALRDFQAAQEAGCDFALVRTGKGSVTEQEIKKIVDSKPSMTGSLPHLRGIYDNLHSAVLNIFL